MRTIPTDHRNTDGQAPTSAWLLQNPIEFIVEDHFRLRAMCADLDRLAGLSHLPSDTIQKQLEYLRKELPLLLADEDDELLPRLSLRAETEDDLPKLIERLDKDHRSIDALLGKVVEALEGVTVGGTVTSDLAQNMRALADVTKRHLILENAVLIPLARIRLTQMDLDDMRGAMLKKRGLEDFFERVAG